MTGLIAMYILTYQTCDVRKFSLQFQVRRKYRVECHNKLLFATKQLHHAVYIVRHKETVLPSGSLRVSASHRQRSERRFPVAIHSFGTEELGSSVKHIHIILRTCNKCFINIFFSHFFCHTSYAPIIICKFQQARN